MGSGNGHPGSRAVWWRIFRVEDEVEKSSSVAQVNYKWLMGRQLTELSKPTVTLWTYWTSSTGESVFSLKNVANSTYIPLSWQVNDRHNVLAICIVFWPTSWEPQSQWFIAFSTMALKPKARLLLSVCAGGTSNRDGLETVKKKWVFH